MTNTFCTDPKNPIRAEGLLRLSQFIPSILPISKSAWWAGVQSGKYPQSIKLGPRTTCWRAADIYELVEGGAEIMASNRAPA